MWHLLTIECFILINVLAFLTVFNVVASVLMRECVAFMCIFWKEYFDAKKAYLKELSEDDLSEPEVAVKRGLSN